MDVKEIKKRRDALAASVSELVNSFQRETGVVVTRAEVEHAWTDERETPWQTSVRLRVALEPEG